MAKKSVSDQMELFEDGGFRDQGNTKDPVSNNPVPVGSTQEEVRDDIPANLSEGEFVLPADVVRYHGLEKIMGFRDQAKSGLQKMENMGQMGNSDQATMPDGVPFKQMALGGTVVNPTIQQPRIVPKLPTQGGGVTTTTPPIVKKPSTYVPPVQPPSDRIRLRDGRLPNYQGPQYRNVPNVDVGMKPTYDDLLGTQFGQLQDSVTKKYVNAETGEEMYIPFVNGEPIYPIPNGFVLETKAKEVALKEDPSKAIKSTSVRQEDNNNDNDGGYQEPTSKAYQVASALSDITYREKGFLDKALDAFQKVSPGIFVANTIFGRKDSEGRPLGKENKYSKLGELLGSQDLAQSWNSPQMDTVLGEQGKQDQLAKASGYESASALQKKIGVAPIFKIGSKAGEISRNTGDFFNQYNQSENTTTGEVAYTSWSDFTKAMGASKDSGWYGGITSAEEAAAKGNTKAQAFVTAMGKSYNVSSKDPTVITETSTKSKITPTVKPNAIQPSDTYTPSKQDQTKNQLNTTAKNLGVNPANYRDTRTLQEAISTKRAENKRERDLDNKVNNIYNDNPTTEQGLTDSSGVSNETGNDENRDASRDSGWTAQGGFINKRTMTMSKTSPNKKKRGGLASRK